MLLSLLLALLPVVFTDQSCAEYIIVERWSNGWKGHLMIPVPKATISWRLDATFDNRILAGDFWAGQKIWKGDKKSVTVLGNDWSAKQKAGSVFKLGFTVNYNEHGPGVDFSTLEITLCWLDGSGCSTCNVLDTECTGAFIAAEAEDETTRTGTIQIMPSQCYSKMPNITLSFSDVIFSGITVPADFSSDCAGDSCVVSSERGLEVNEELQFKVGFPAGVMVLGVVFEGEDLCDVQPELFEEPTLAPTLQPEPTEEVPPTEESEFPNGCARYEIDSTWPNGWKAFLHIPIEKDTVRWRIDAEFNKPVQAADWWAGLPEVWSPTRSSVTILGKDWSARQAAGTVFHTGFTANHAEGDNVYIKNMRLKLCWAEGGKCTVCDIVKEACSSGLTLSTTATGESNKMDGVISKTITRCENDMSPITLEFDRPLKRLIVPRGRYVAECSERVCVVSTARPMRVKTGDELRIKTTAVFHHEKGALVGLKYGSEDICHEK